MNHSNGGIESKTSLYIISKEFKDYLDSYIAEYPCYNGIRYSNRLSGVIEKKLHNQIQTRFFQQSRESIKTSRHHQILNHI